MDKSNGRGFALRRSVSTTSYHGSSSLVRTVGRGAYTTVAWWLILHLWCSTGIHARSVATAEVKEFENDRPIIGILSQEISYSLNKSYPNMYDSFIAASYVKLIEGAGALVVPIWIGQDESYYEEVLGKVNGVLWPGGSSYFNRSDGYADAGRIIYKIATSMNEAGDYFPILGICLGFELLTYVAANGVEHRTDCSSNRQPLPLEFKDDYRSSKMFRNAPESLIDILTEYNVTGNYHQYCVTEEDLEEVHLTDVLRVISVNRDWNGLEFVSSLEHATLPFYGLQFHPEKNLYEWIGNRAIPRGFRASLASQYFANFFVNEARKNDHSFPAEEEVDRLIYNYPLTYTALVANSYTQCYLFANTTPTTD